MLPLLGVPMSALPSGTVTFLFTDIEGSTARWERDRVAMAEAVARHFTLLRRAVGEQRGTMFKIVGDAAQVAFPTAPEALSAAIAAQHAMLAESWPTPVHPLRVRMALHTAAAEPHDGDYLAPGLNRLARLLSTAHGGQVLVSLASHDLARDALPPGAGLRDLGEHRLRDIYRPERVFQLVHADLPFDFPPLRTLASRPNNLPLQPTTFLGRERELAQVCGLVRRDEVRLLTLTGPGGVGKTRLASQAAAELLDAFADGAWFVDLAPLADQALVPSTIAVALGVQEAGGHGIVTSLTAFLGGKALLLVLDNFEHVVQAAPVIAELLAAAPGVKVLVTSRARLGLRGEHELPVPPLGVPDPARPVPPDRLTEYEAVRLFVARAAEVAPGFAVDNETAPAVAELCVRLDGLPLAIELAAARVKVLPPAALLRRLEKRLPVLTGGARDLPARQQTLRDAIAWSYDLLAPDEQALFRRLAVFAGGGTFDAIEAVADPDRHVDLFEAIASLIDKSLVRQREGPDGEPRFWMLETIREFGQERLTASGEDGATRRRHADWCVALAEAVWMDVILPGQERWLARLEAEHANLRAALAWLEDARDAEAMLRLAGSLWMFWFVRSHLREGKRWTERALALSDQVTPETRARALFGLGLLAVFGGADHAAEAPLAESLVLWRKLGNRLEEALALTGLGSLAWFRGEHTLATTHKEAALSLYQELGEEVAIAPPLVSDTLNDLGFIAYAAGDAVLAQARFEEALLRQRALGFTWGAVQSLRGLGDLARDHGDDAEALERYGESLSLAVDLGDRKYAADALAGVANVAAMHGQLGRAARLLGAVDELRTVTGAAVFPSDRAAADRAESAIRAGIGNAAAEAAKAAGRALSTEDAVAEALALVVELRDGTTETSLLA
jgi:predicted ATPase/class 3 adenylate cyclase